MIAKPNNAPSGALVLAPTQAVTMTSREIAELTNKQHQHVKRDIEKMLIELKEDASTFGRIYLDSLNREQSEYLLDRDLTENLLMGYSAVLRRKVLARLRELEAQVSVPPPLPTRTRAAQQKAPLMIAVGMAGPVKRGLKAFGLTENAATIAANQIIAAETGVNLLALAGHTHLVTPTQELCFTPTELGSRRCMSAKSFNKLLASCGLQENVNGHWVPTAKGKPFAVVLDTGKAHGNGTPIQQVKWIDSVMSEVAL